MILYQNLTNGSFLMESETRSVKFSYCYITIYWSVTFCMDLLSTGDIITSPTGRLENVALNIELPGVTYFIT